MNADANATPTSGISPTPQALSRRLTCIAAAAAPSIATGPIGGAKQQGATRFNSSPPRSSCLRPTERASTAMRSMPACCPEAAGSFAVFVATRLNAPPDALVAWMRAIAELKRSKFVLAIGRFSDLEGGLGLTMVLRDAAHGTPYLRTSTGRRLTCCKDSAARSCAVCSKTASNVRSR